MCHITNLHLLIPICTYANTHKHAYHLHIHTHRYLWPNARTSVMGGEQAANVLATVQVRVCMCVFICIYDSLQS